MFLVDGIFPEFIWRKIILKRRKIIFFILSFLVTVFIFKNSLEVASASDKKSMFFVDFLINNFSFIFKNEVITNSIIRKVAHFLEFFTQGCFLSAAIFSLNYNKNAIYVLFSGLLTACTDEFIQLFVEGRAGMVSDIFIDFFGTLAAVIIFVVVWFILEKRRKRA